MNSRIDEKFQNEIKDIVTQAVIASKGVESNFYGVLNKHIAKHDEYATQLSEQYKIVITGIGEIKNIIEKIKEEHNKLDNKVSIMKESSGIGIKIMVGVVSVFIPVLAYFAINIIDVKSQVSANTVLINKK